ncbi:hypothetical protein BK141_01070 [Paenibacillus sp. FSL R5-0765]|uniref:hypothetical protein n=1 Tax=Paenibacillus sp. FSL R5-0765 TaxID=1920425 RepID=UPI00096DEB30|nr:hypothetical protein [Paenibacillus sp. FSL R5-0765]OMF67450.1 hypothetical protein BK141_01070 [Paenibacillus sp. FSL R5-0765]
MVDMYLIILVAILGMILFYSLIAYFLIRFISKKALKLTLTKYEMMEIMTWLAVLFITFMMIKTGSMNLLLPVVVLIIPLINLRLSNRKHRELN